MAYSEAVLLRAKQRLEQAKGRHEQDERERIADVFARVPRLAEIDRELRKTAARICAAAFRSNTDPQAAIEQLRTANLALQREREWLLESNEIDPDELNRTPFCPLCDGTGYRGAVMCDCLRELCRQEQKKELNTLLGGGKESFERFRADLYPAEYDERLGASPRTLMQKTYEKCVRYAQAFSPVSPSLLFMGATGLGKTFLSACIARSVAERGFSVCYVSAETLFSDFEAQKFRPGDHDRTRRYFDCDLLILDDLGTEMTTQFTVSALYQVVNTRLTAQKPTIISSNVAVKELENRYSPQIASRLLGAYTLFKFYGTDIRMKIDTQARANGNQK